MFEIILPKVVRRWMGVAVLLCGFPTMSFATITSINIPIEALQPDAAGSLADDVLVQHIAALLREELQNSGLLLQDNGLTSNFTIEGMNSGGCSANVTTDTGVANVRFANGSTFDLLLDGIRNITLRANLIGQISLIAPTKVEYGANLFGHCEQYARDSGNLLANASFNMELVLQVLITPAYDSDNEQIILDKFAELSATSSFSGIDIDGDFGGLNITGILIEATESRLKDRFEQNSKQLVADIVHKTNNRLNGLDAAGNADPAYSPPFNAVSVFQLPPEIHNSAIARQLITQLGLPDVLFNSLDEAPGQILYILLALDGQEKAAALADLGSSIMCDAIVEKYDTPLPHTPVYALINGQCLAADLYGSDHGEYFADAQCEQAVAFQPNSATEFCQNYSSQYGKTVLGNAAAWGADTDQINDPLPQVKTQPWTTTLVTRLDLGTLSKAGLPNPFLKRASYKKVATGRGNGTCELEMRIYKPAISAVNLTPLMAIHGGTWSSRGFSYLGLEASMPFLMEKGYIVFAPFYRLVNEKDANVECNGAGWREIMADIRDALHWVKEHGPALGASNAPVSLFGQSAGANLAIWLALEQAESIGKVLALYPPLDTIEFIHGLSTSEYSRFAEFGLRALTSFYGARGGSAEIDFTGIEVAGLNPQLSPAAFSDMIPDYIFNFSALSLDNLPAYLKRCADELAIETNQINLLQPSAELLGCVKRDVSEFLLAESYFHRIDSATPPIMIIQGSEDALVPPQQAVKLCRAQAADAVPATLDQFGEITEVDCGPRIAMKMISGAKHMLDFGLCVGDLCPAGPETSNTRIHVIEAMRNAYDWLARRPGSLQHAENSSGGGGHMWSMLLMFIFAYLFATIRNVWLSALP